ncbi:MAG: hypothetical protein ACREMQ_03920, partial [Longimicrobiales bacterium]
MAKAITNAAVVVLGGAVARLGASSLAGPLAMALGDGGGGTDEAAGQTDGDGAPPPPSHDAYAIVSEGDWAQAAP